MTAWRRIALTAAALWGMGLVLNRSLRRITGTSMLPVLGPGALVLTVPLRGRPSLGDVVLAHVPGVGETVKRVIASPRQDVRLDEGHLARDGVWHHEVYATTGDDEHHHLPPADGWVLLGDNRTSSTDSRTFGRVPRDAITRRVLLRVNSPRRLRLPAMPRPNREPPRSSVEYDV